MSSGSFTVRKTWNPFSCNLAVFSAVNKW
jgi:hypothetical protein